MIGWELLAGNTDLFSYWGFLSGAFKTEEGMASQLNDRPDDAYPIHWLYAGDGADAQGWRPYMHKTEYLDKHCGALKLGENFCFVAVEQTSHNFSAWDIGLINKYYDLARAGDILAKEHYRTLEKTAADCVHCRHCDRRCPFGVKQSDRMREIAKYMADR